MQLPYFFVCVFVVLDSCRYLSNINKETCKHKQTTSFVEMAFTQPLLNHESVQELAMEHNLTVPHYYVQEQREPTFVPNDSSPLPSIPVIDMNNLIMQGSNMDLQLKNLRLVCHEWGIFQVKNLLNYSSNLYVPFLL